jgi:Flp pilus assembly pilin Flp
MYTNGNSLRGLRRGKGSKSILVSDLHVGALWSQGCITIRQRSFVSPEFTNTKDKMMNIMKRLWQEEGQDLVEYGLLIVLISLLSVAAMKNLASSISNAFQAAATQLNSGT